MRVRCSLAFRLLSDLQQVQAERFSFVTTVFILAGGHVRASAGALAVHTALIRVRACLRVCPVSNSFFITPRIGTRFVSVDR